MCVVACCEMGIEFRPPGGNAAVAWDLPPILLSIVIRKIHYDMRNYLVLTLFLSSKEQE